MTSNNPLISIITLSYNSEYIDDTILSVLNQDYPNIEYIISDDGSVCFDLHEKKSFIEKYKKNNIRNLKIINHKTNTGTVKNMNSAIRECNGEYIFTLSGDDVFENSSIISEWVEEFLITKANIITTYRAVYDDKLNKMLYITPKKKQVRKIKEYTSSRLYNDLRKENYILGSVTARTKVSVTKYGLFDEKYRLLEDYPKIMQMLRCDEQIFFWDKVAVRCRNKGVSSYLSNNNLLDKDMITLLNRELLRYGKDREQILADFSNWDAKNKMLKRFYHDKTTLETGVLKKILFFSKYPYFSLRELLKCLRNFVMFNKIKK